MAERIKTIYTPWTYLEELVRTDRSSEHDEVWMTEKLQKQFPGNYRVEKILAEDNWYDYYIVFDNPKEEMLFNIKWA